VFRRLKNLAVDTSIIPVAWVLDLAHNPFVKQQKKTYKPNRDQNVKESSSQNGPKSSFWGPAQKGTFWGARLKHKSRRGVFNKAGWVSTFREKENTTTEGCRDETSRSNVVPTGNVPRSLCASTSFVSRDSLEYKRDAVIPICRSPRPRSARTPRTHGPANPRPSSKTS